jgi:hypothetical protein
LEIDVTSIPEHPTHPLLANSVPKAGTHLLRNCLSLFPGIKDVGIHLEVGMPFMEIEQSIAKSSAGELLTGHLIYTDRYAALIERYQLHQFLILRDPRDVVVSFTFHVLNHPSHPAHSLYRSKDHLDKHLFLSICGYTSEDGDETVWNIGRIYRAFLQWSESSNVCVVRFEELIGPRGGGNLDLQRNAVLRLAEHIEIKLSESTLVLICDQTYDPESPTFRRGLIGGWKHYLGHDHLEALHDVAGDVMDTLGYA